MMRLPPESAIFAENVRILRQQRGWSQAELARRVTEAGAPMKANRVATIEASGPDPRTVSIDQAAAFAEALGVQLDALFKVRNENARLALAWGRYRQADEVMGRALNEYNAALAAVVAEWDKAGRPLPPDHWMRKPARFERAEALPPALPETGDDDERQETP